MDISNFTSSCADLESFCDFVFSDCSGKPLRANLGACVEARLSTAKRKTHQPAGIQLAATPEQACGLRQKLNRTTLSTRWSDDQARLRLLEVARQHVGRPVALIIDDTGFIKKGNKSPGVQRQYCGKAGKRENCQLVVSTHLSGWNCSQPLQAELYLPEVWINDLERRREAGIPDEMEFRTKPQIALEQVDWILAAGLPPQIILADAGYGNSGPFREGLRERNLEYVVAIQPSTSVWRPGQGPDPLPETNPSSGRRQTRRYPGTFEPVSVRALADELDARHFKMYRLRRGRHQTREVRAAAIRLHTAPKAYHGCEPGPEEWLIVIWPPGKPEPTDFFLSNMGRRVRPKRVIELGCLRWRVERDYQDMKQDVGMEHYEGRTWVGWNHHLTICMAAFAFLAIQRKLFPPETPRIDRLGAQANHQKSGS